MQTSLLQSGRCPTTAARGALPRPSGWRVGTECRSACDPKPRRTCDLVSRGGGVGAVGCHLRRRCLHSCPWVCVRPQPGAAEDAPPRVLTEQAYTGCWLASPHSGQPCRCPPYVRCSRTPKDDP